MEEDLSFNGKIRDPFNEPDYAEWSFEIFKSPEEDEWPTLDVSLVIGQRWGAHALINFNPWRDSTTKDSALEHAIEDGARSIENLKAFRNDLEKTMKRLEEEYVKLVARRNA